MTSVVVLASCSDDEEGSNQCTYRLEVGNSFSAQGDLDKAMAYLNAVSSAYEKALGMTDSEVTFSGSASNYSAQMKSKFENATLPTALDPSKSQYSFTIELAVYDGSKSKEVIASKKFSNE